MKILETRQSSRNPEVMYRIIETDSGERVCNCPACYNGGECYPMMKLRVLEESRRLQQIKNDLSGIKIPDKQKLIDQQWEYIRKRELECLTKYPDEAWKYRHLILQMKERLGPVYNHPAVQRILDEPNQKQLEHRASTIRLLSLFKRDLALSPKSSENSVATPKTGNKPTKSGKPNSFLWATQSLKRIRMRRNSKSLD